MIDVELSNIWGSVSLPDLLSGEKDLFDAHMQLRTNTLDGPDFLGWLNAPEGVMARAVLSIGKAAERIAELGDTLVIVGSGDAPAAASPGAAVSRLAQWPCQLRLVPVNAPYFDGAKLLVCADCAAYACARLHEDFMRGKITLIGCPKLDAVDYSQKLAAIFAQNDVRSVTLLRMEVPCCGGLEFAAKKAIAESGKELSLRVVTISIEGEILADEA